MVNNYNINAKMVNLIPKASDLDVKGMTESISKSGQLVAAWIWRDELIDGRTRMEACNKLGIPLVVERIPSDKTESEVLDMVIGTIVGRDLTPTQKAMTALRYKLESSTKVTNKELSKLFGVSIRTLENAMYIYKTNRSIAEALWDNKAVKVKNSSGKSITTTSINSVCIHLKRLEEQIKVVEYVHHDWDYGSYIKTQAGKDWFYTQLELVKEHGMPKIMKLLADTANLMFIEDYSKKENDYE